MKVFVISSYDYPWKISFKAIVNQRDIKITEELETQVKYLYERMFDCDSKALGELITLLQRHGYSDIIFAEDGVIEHLPILKLDE